MSNVRLMPVLLVSHGRLVKTTRFKNPVYVGDPVNTVRIFNELGVDEIVVLDISASSRGRGPDFGLIQEIAEECFMPLTYGGGVRNIRQIEKLLLSGAEKVAIRAAFTRGPEIISEAAAQFGSQAVVVAIDAQQKPFGGWRSLVDEGVFSKDRNPARIAEVAQEMGAGEVFLTSVSSEGSWSGFDYDLIRDVSERLTIPVVANGGAGSKEDILSLANTLLVSGIAVGSMSVFQKQGKGVLVNFPRLEELGGTD